MPNGRERPVAKTSLTSGLPSPSLSRRMWIRPAWLSLRKTSPFGARTIDRGFLKPVANSVTSKPSGTFGQAPSGRLTMRGWLFDELVSYGAASSSSVIRRRTPGASVVQSPSASLPLSVVRARGASSAALADVDPSFRKQARQPAAISGKALRRVVISSSHRRCDIPKPHVEFTELSARRPLSKSD